MGNSGGSNSQVRQDQGLELQEDAHDRGVGNYGIKEHKQGKMTPDQETGHP